MVISASANGNDGGVVEGWESSSGGVNYAACERVSVLDLETAFLQV